MIKQLENWEFKLSAYNLALTTMSFDMQTVAPKDGEDYRNDRFGFLSGEYYNILTDKNMYEVLNKLSNENNLDEINSRKVKLYLNMLNQAKVLSEQEYIEFSKLKLKAFQVWEKARSNSDYRAFEPYLKHLIDKSIYIAEKRNANIKPYDFLLNDFEEGMDSTKYDVFFDLIKERIIPLIKKVNENSYKVDSSILKNNYDLDKQIAFNKEIMDYLRFDKSWSHNSTSVHPFTSALSIDDVRITTRYNKNDLFYSVFSTIHEIGHGTFDHQIDKKFDGTILETGITMGIHESQSRLFENYFGKNYSFWKYNYNKLIEHFDFFKDISIDDFLKAISASKPSLIRTEADELTYPIHILIRYEIEKGIFDKTISTDNLNKVWNEKVKEYLGIDVDCDGNGILQDIHWTDASFGYFPAYALGSAYSAQIYKTMSKQLNIEEILENNRFEEINEWLKNKIHKWGALRTPSEMLISVTNEDFNPIYYIEYLEEKYKKLYELQ